MDVDLGSTLYFGFHLTKVHDSSRAFFRCLSLISVQPFSIPNSDDPPRERLFLGEDHAFGQEPSS